MQVCTWLSIDSDAYFWIVPSSRTLVEIAYFTASSWKDIVESVGSQNIVDFIREAHFLSSAVVFVTYGS